jgi:hypothetical protein
MAFYSCHVLRAGPADDGEIYIWLRDQGGAFNHWFKAHDTLRKEMLMTALTAISTGFFVDAALSSPTEYGTIDRLYIRR